MDANHKGKAARVRVADMFWGRLVDVHDIDAAGEPSTAPVFRDLTINENIQTDVGNYSLETNAITQETRLVIRRTKGAPDMGNGTFSDLLQRALDGLPAVIPKNDDGTSSPPFSFITRNATLVIRFDDLMDDSQESVQNLPETVKVLVGYPPTEPFAARLVFDPNFGDVTNNNFHSTRLLIDMTVSEAEASDMAVAQPVNSLGLPASLTTSEQANVSIRIPSQVDFGSGQFEILTNVSGGAMATTQNGPIDPSSPTEDVVRAMRSGNPEDLNNGFLVDLNAPEVVGGWALTVENAQPDPMGEPGFDFLVRMRFDTVCRAASDPGDILSIGSRFLEVTQPTPPPDAGGVVANVSVRVLTDDPVTNIAVILGSGLFLSTLDPGLAVPDGCWVAFAPQPDQVPATGVVTQAAVLVRFTEPMDPLSVTAFDTFLLVRGDSSTQPVPTNIVVGRVAASSELRDFTFSPQLPFAHVSGQPDSYHVLLSGPTDLAGNALANQLGAVDFSIDAQEPTVSNSGHVLRFSAPDEIEPIGLPDIRGQFFFDLGRGVIEPRPASYSSVAADRNNPVPSIMIPFPRPIQTPLSPLGSKMQTVWRYVDLGWQVLDETKFNIDVVGLNWSPFGGLVVSDFYPEFEMLLAHSRKQPDEAIDAFLLPRFQNSGLFSRPNPYTSNILPDPLSPQKVVHPRSQGYLINPANLFVGNTGTPLIPFPMNRTGQPTLLTFTWRDTAALSTAAPSGAGIPLDIEVGAPLFLDDGPQGSIAGPGQVPTFALPLLMEYRCYPTDSAVGLNGFDISLAINSSALPNFRAYSTGGLDTTNTPVIKNPTNEIVPSGGFNPASSPPGKPTARQADNSFYLGQLDFVIRVSRVHTVWLDTLFTSPDYQEPIVEPGPTDQPAGTQVVIDYRGANGFTGAGTDPLNASSMDPYGEIATGTVDFFDGDSTWRSQISDLDGAQHLQLRISFINNIASQLNAEVSAIGIGYENP